MKHSIDFFRDEVRNGFYIPTAIKQGWAATLDVLEEIDRICEKYRITYYADWGSFLGAVRHGGFIPWDDDLDICMKRDDYEKFRKVADRELPGDFTIHDYERHENHWLFLARVVHPERMCFDVEYQTRHYNFPWLAGVDIFLKDYLYPDPELEKSRDCDVMEILAAADGLLQGGMNKAKISALLQHLREKYHVLFPPVYKERDLAVALYRLAEEQMARVKNAETDRIGQIFPWILKNGPEAGEKKEHYAKTIRLPFEDTTIPVPAYYHKVLTSRYGNYLSLSKEWDGHDYPSYEGQKEEMERVAKVSFPGFSFQSDMLLRPRVDENASFKATTEECLAEFDRLLKELKKVTGHKPISPEAPGAEAAGTAPLSPEAFSEVQRICENCQTLAVDLGTLTEQVMGEKREGTRKAVGALEHYCEALYLCLQSIAAGKIREGLEILGTSLESVREALDHAILNRRIVLFLPIGPKEWKAFQRLYEEEMLAENTDCYVVPLPLLPKDPLGQVKMAGSEMDELVRAEEYPEFPDGVFRTDWSSFEISMYCPDVIYYQNPYDGENPYLTVPPDFYAGNMRVFAGELIYVPFAKTNDISMEDSRDSKDRHNLKAYVTAPGLVYADRIYVWSEKIKDLYVKVLAEFSGGKTEEIWKRKIRIKSYPGLTRRQGKKRLLFCIGANELSEKKEVLADALRSRLALFSDASTDLEVSVAFYPEDRTQWERVNKELTGSIFELAENAVREGICTRICSKVSDAEKVAADFDAYYGSPSPYVPAFMTRKLPVMIADFEVEASSFRKAGDPAGS